MIIMVMRWRRAGKCLGFLYASASIHAGERFLGDVDVDTKEHKCYTIREREADLSRNRIRSYPDRASARRKRDQFIAKLCFTSL